MSTDIAVAHAYVLGAIVLFSFGMWVGALACCALAVYMFVP